MTPRAVGRRAAARRFLVVQAAELGKAVIFPGRRQRRRGFFRRWVLGQRGGGLWWCGGVGYGG
jgi:hypothetical protein